MKSKEELKNLAELLYPNVTMTVEQMLAKYPQRTGTAFRLAPSPTGYLHIGSLGMCIVNTRLAKSTGGIAYLRIEDTDQKREVEGAVPMFISALARFGIVFDEGFDGVKDYGKYGPYVQSKRVDIYHVFAKKLVELGRAYPCFCNEEDIAKTRAKQEQKKQKTGYYGEYAACKDLTLTDVRENLSSGKKWALRLDTSADEGRRISWKDCIKGDMTLPVEVNHPVVVKSNGIPPYNFAHVVDDTLMRTSHVIRGEEWLVSTAEHIQIFEALGLQHPNYAHPPVICIDDNGNKRKLSKRKDKEAVAENFLRVGYPVEAVTEYLMTLYNTDFEMWRIKNPKAKNTEFAFTFERIGSNSPLFDWNKVNDISKNVIAKMSCMEVNREAKAFFEKTLRDGAAEEKAAAEKVLGNFEKVCAVLAIDRETDKPRKDIVKYSDIVSLYDYIFSAPAVASNDIAAAYAKVYKDTDTKEEWFDRVKALASGLGYATSVKEYKQAAETFRGHVGDVAQAIRQSVTGRDNTPDLYAILKILGKEEVTKRLIGR